MKERKLIWSTFHIDEAEVGGSLRVGTKHGFWVDVYWNSIGLGKGNSDWCWLIGHKVLEVSSGDIGVHEFEEAI